MKGKAARNEPQKNNNNNKVKRGNRHFECLIYFLHLHLLSSFFFLFFFSSLFFLLSSLFSLLSSSFLLPPSFFLLPSFFFFSFLFSWFRSLPEDILIDPPSSECCCFTHMTCTHPSIYSWAITFMLIESCLSENLSWVNCLWHMSLVTE